LKFSLVLIFSDCSCHCCSVFVVISAEARASPLNTLRIRTSDAPACSSQNAVRTQSGRSQNADAGEPAKRGSSAKANQHAGGARTECRM